MVKKVENIEELNLRLKELLRLSEKKLSLRRVQCIYFKVKYGKTPREIAEMVGYHWSYVKEIQAKFNKDGISALCLKTKGGRYFSKLKISEEKEVIKEFEEKAKIAGIIGILEIHKAFEEKAGERNLAKLKRSGTLS